MKFLALLSVLCFAPGVIFSQCEDCSFIRGDANCDGAVNISDVIALANGSPLNNLDAADANDDGSVDISDSVYLSHHLFQGTAAPPCPYPSAGHDCTADSLETCCSPPTGRQSGILPSALSIASWLTGTWDSETSATVTVGARQLGRFTTQNWSSCAKPSCGTWYTYGWNYTDTTGYTKKRIDNGIQQVKVILRLDINFFRGAACTAPYCAGSNSLNVDLNDATVTIYFKPKAGGANQSITRTVNSNLVWTYSLNNNCVFTAGSTATTWLEVTLDISDEAAALAAGDCDEWVFVSATIDTIDPEFTVVNRDIATTEKIVGDVELRAVYTWCTCP